MGMTAGIRGAISVLTAIVGLYVIEITFPMNALYVQFNALIPNMSMTTAWKATSQATLGGWVWYDRAFVICIIAVFVWWVSLIFIEADYSKQRGY